MVRGGRFKKALNDTVPARTRPGLTPTNCDTSLHIITYARQRLQDTVARYNMSFFIACDDRREEIHIIFSNKTRT